MSDIFLVILFLIFCVTIIPLYLCSNPHSFKTFSQEPYFLQSRQVEILDNSSNFLLGIIVSEINSATRFISFLISSSETSNESLLISNFIIFLKSQI